MTTPAPIPGHGILIERALILLLIGALGYACVEIVLPFLVPFIWAVILAVSTWPYYLKAAEGLGGRRGLAAVVLTLGMLLLFVVPAFDAFDSVTHYLPYLSKAAAQLSALSPDQPPDWVAQLPLVGTKLDETLRTGKLNSFLSPEKVRPILTSGAGWLLQQGAGLALAALHIVLAVILAGLLYANGETASATAERVALRIGGPSGIQALRVAGLTVRGVSLGVIGTALLQAVLSGLGFALAGVPGAGVLGLLCFLAATLQIGTGIVWIPTAIWLAHQGSEGWAAFTVVWGIFINVIDNFIKPYLIGKTSPLPFLLILVGVIGGLLAWGFVGIFLGTTLLAVAYTVFLDWLEPPGPGNGASPG